MRLYTLGSKGSRELKTFLKTRLISSRVDQKLKNKEGKYMLLKGEIGPKIVANWSGRGGWFMASWERFLGTMSWLPFCFRIAIILATIGPRSGHDRAAIGPRSWSRSFVDRRALEWRWFHHVSSPIAARSRRDRGSIEPLSWSSSTIIICRPMEIKHSGEVHASPHWEEIRTIKGHPMEIQAIVIRTIPVVRAICCRPRDVDRTHQKAPRVAKITNDRGRPMKIGWLRSAPDRKRLRPSDEDPCFLDLPRVAHLADHLKCISPHAWLMIASTRVHAISAILLRSDACRASTSPAR